MKDLRQFYKNNIEKLRSLALDCPECIQLAIPCHHYDYLKRYIEELESLPPFDHEKFDAFWEAYPSKKSKKLVEKIWARMGVNDDLFERIMTGLEQQKKSLRWTKDNGEFIPNPSTWLNQERWEDEVKISTELSDKYKKYE